METKINTNMIKLHTHTHTHNGFKNSEIKNVGTSMCIYMIS